MPADQNDDHEIVDTPLTRTQQTQADELTRLLKHKDSRKIVEALCVHHSQTVIEAFARRLDAAPDSQEVKAFLESLAKHLAGPLRTAIGEAIRPREGDDGDSATSVGIRHATSAVDKALRDDNISRDFMKELLHVVSNNALAVTSLIVAMPNPEQQETVNQKTINLGALLQTMMDNKTSSSTHNIVNPAFREYISHSVLTHPNSAFCRIETSNEAKSLMNMLAECGDERAKGDKWVDMFEKSSARTSFFITVLAPTIGALGALSWAAYKNPYSSERFNRLNKTAFNEIADILTNAALTKGKGATAFNAVTIPTTKQILALDIPRVIGNTSSAATTAPPPRPVTAIGPGTDSSLLCGRCETNGWTGAFLYHEEATCARPSRNKPRRAVVPAAPSRAPRPKTTKRYAVPPAAGKKQHQGALKGATRFKPAPKQPK